MLQVCIIRVILVAYHFLTLLSTHFIAVITLHIYTLHPNYAMMYALQEHLQIRNYSNAL